MSKVVITRSKLDSLATTISAKSGEPLPLTIAQMDAAVQGIETGGSTPSLQSKTATPTTSQQTISPDTGYDGLSQVTVNPIPSNYGLITWDGSVLTVS